ncbi:hypothetical protein Taitung35_13590 [Helicobacter pylori]
MQTIHIGVLSASDRASKGIYEDLSGKGDTRSVERIFAQSFRISLRNCR